VHSNGPFAPDDSVFRLRQHGTFYLFPEKDLGSSALPEALSPAKRGIAGYMSALAVSRFSLISYLS
jgi:hypothetical protein